MTKSKKTNKVSMDDIFVVSADKVTPTGKFVNSTTAFKDLTTGRLAILAWDFDSSVRSLGDYKQSGDDSNEVQAIKVIVGTPVSNQTEFADIWGVGHAAYQESGVINKTNIRSVAVKQARFATNGIDCGVFYFTPEDNVEYKAYVRLKSVRNDRFYGDNDEVVHAIVPATDFTALSLTSDLDYVLQKLAYEFNSQSKAVTLTGNAATSKGNKNFVVFGVKQGGGSGVVINTLAVGDSIPFMTVNGVDSTITATESLIQGLATVFTDGGVVTASTIEVLDLSTAGTAATIDTLLVVGLPHGLATAYDEIEQVMVDPELNLGGAFITGVTPASIFRTKCSPNEGTGSGRKWLIEWRHRAGLNVHTAQIQPHGDWFSEGKHYINEDHYYTSYIIEYFDTEDTLTSTEVSPKKLVLLFRAEVLSTVTQDVDTTSGTDNLIVLTVSNGAGTGTDNVLSVASVEANLTAWLEHARTTGNPFRVTGNAVAGGTYLS